jgi:hypothetical protein
MRKQQADNEELEQHVNTLFRNLRKASQCRISVDGVSKAPLSR